MGKLLNVRLSDEEAVMVDRLRQKGITISEVVRLALRGEYARQGSQGEPDGVQILEELYKKHPAPRGHKRRRLDTTDRRQVAAFMRRKLRAQLKSSRGRTSK